MFPEYMLQAISQEALSNGRGDKDMEIEELITIIIAILIAVVVFKVFMWLLPVVVVLAIAYVIYRYLQERNI